MNNIRIGTCSWKYDSWRGLVYTDAPQINYLKEYSSKFNTVEIDQWFWSLHPNNKITLPQSNVVQAYKNSVSPNFKFTIKIPNSITLTHEYSRKKGDPGKPNKYFLSNELFDQFIFLIEPLGKNLGPLMFQFEYLNKQKMESQLKFQNLIEGFLNNSSGEYTYALEIRNPNYYNKDFFDFVRDMKILPVFLQGYYMPPIWEIINKYEYAADNGIVIRLHGPDRKGIEERSGGNWSRIIEPKDGELEKIVSIIQKLSLKKIDIYLNVNNHYEGSAPLTIEKIKNMLD